MLLAATARATLALQVLASLATVLTSTLVPTMHAPSLLRVPTKQRRPWTMLLAGRVLRIRLATMLVLWYQMLQAQGIVRLLWRQAVRAHRLQIQDFCAVHLLVQMVVVQATLLQAAALVI